jgi:hypothetical protein
VNCHQWRLKGKQLTATSLGQHVQSLDLLFQLVHNKSDVYQIIKALVTGSSLPGTTCAPDLKPVTSGTSFWILQGLDSKMKKHLLFQVYKGELTWKDMDQEASIIKARSKVMTTLTATLEKETWDNILEEIGQEWAEEFIGQWVSIFQTIQLNKKETPDGFKDHTLQLVTRHEEKTTLDTNVFWTHTFPNSSKVTSCNLPFGEYST